MTSLGENQICLLTILALVYKHDLLNRVVKTISQKL